MSQVLTYQTDNEDQRTILIKLAGYNKPVKTKHLSQRLNMERPDLVANLNQLRAKGAVKFVKTSNELRNDYRGREEISFGWVIVKI